MAKRILILKGSPRRNGNSSILADRAADGARQAGAVVEVIFLEGMRITPCTACEACHDGEPECIIADDMRDLYPKLRQADALIIASPVYWFSMSAQTKLMVDRWYALEQKGGNELKGKKIGIILTYGDTNLETSGGIHAVGSFESMFRYIGCPIVGIVHGTAGAEGDVLKKTSLLEQAFRLGQSVAAG
jgi:multimeric flavodoxin WrbA